MLASKADVDHSYFLQRLDLEDVLWIEQGGFACSLLESFFAQEALLRNLGIESQTLIGRRVESVL